MPEFTSKSASKRRSPAIMTSPYEPYGKIYTILSEEWASYLWPHEPVSIPQVFREHLVLVLGWTTGRQGYVSIAMVSVAPPTNHLPPVHSDHALIVSRSPRISPMEPTQTTTSESGPHAVELLPTRLRLHCERTKDFPRLWNYHMSDSTACGRCHLLFCWVCRGRGCS